MSEETSAGRKMEVYGASSSMRGGGDRAGKDARLIAAVRARRSLYDNTHPRYMDYNHKLNVWREVGEQLKANPTACKTRWNNIRDNYRKSLRRRRPGQRARNNYKYADQLAFMTKFLRATFDSDDDDDGLSSDDKDDENDEKRVPVKMAIEFPVKDNNNSDDQQEPMVDYEFFGKKESGSSFPVFPPSTHAVDAFLAGISPTLKALSPYHLGLAKAEIFATVHKYEMRGIAEGGRLKEVDPLPCGCGQ